MMVKVSINVDAIAAAFRAVKPVGKVATAGERKAWSDAVRAFASTLDMENNDRERFYERAGMYGDRGDSGQPS